LDMGDTGKNLQSVLVVIINCVKSFIVLPPWEKSKNWNDFYQT